MKIDWKRKLTSRKFWAAIIGFITPLMVIFGVPSITAEQVVAVIGAVAVLIAYILGEGFVDSKTQTPVKPDEAPKFDDESSDAK